MTFGNCLAVVDNEPLVRTLRCRTVVDTFSIGGAQVIPMLGRKVVEGQQRVAIKDVDRRFGGRPVRRPTDLAQILLHGGLNRERDLVLDVHGLVHPASLMPCAGKELVERLPEPERAVADGDFGGDLGNPRAASRR